MPRLMLFIYYEAANLLLGKIEQYFGVYRNKFFKEVLDRVNHLPKNVRSELLDNFGLDPKKVIKSIEEILEIQN